MDTGASPGESGGVADGTDVLTNDYGRYEHFEKLGEGGMGLVYACVDPHLGRRLALKVLRPEINDRPRDRKRFSREARIMAQLEHPNIVPVHEYGATDQGANYFTMKRVKGTTLHDIIRQLSLGDVATHHAYPRSRLLHVFLDVCHAVAFAHSHGVIHRDLKPSNILIGSFGEVLVMDWGLAKVIGHEEEDGGITDTSDAAASASLSMAGGVTGTPMYMAPEQARGDTDNVGKHSDIYGLGTILYELLTFLHTTHATEVREILLAVAKDPVVSPRRVAPKKRISRELEAICMKALRKRPADRYESVDRLIADVEATLADRPVSVWRDPPLRRAWKWCLRHPVVSTSTAAVTVALVFTVALIAGLRAATYQDLMSESDNLRLNGHRAHTQRMREGRQLLDLRAGLIDKVESSEERELSDRLSRLSQQVEKAYETSVMLNMMATHKAPTARQRNAVVDIVNRRLDYALMRGDHGEVGKWVDLAREWLGPDFVRATPVARAKLQDAELRMQGQGSLQIDGRDGALSAVRLEPDEKGRLLAGPSVVLSGLPGTVPVSKGSFLVTLTQGDRQASFPVWIPHGGDRELHLAMPSPAPPGMVHVPAGPARLGGEQARHFRLHEKTLAGFYIKQHEVTFGEYLRFWLAPEGGNRASAHMSRIRLDHASRAFLDAWDSNGVLRLPLRDDLPVVGVTQASAQQYCSWRSGRDGRPYRLPTADEWEKAARGVDGRHFPWGNGFDATFSYSIENHGARDRFGPWAPPGSFPVDCSVYGAFDMAGNVREWTAIRFPGDTPFFQIKGGSASLPRRFQYGCYASDTPVVPSDVGFRYVCAETE